MAKFVRIDSNELNALRAELALKNKLLNEPYKSQVPIIKNKLVDALFKNVNCAILLGTTDGEILEVNAATCKIFGYSREEFRQIGRKDIVVMDENINKFIDERNKYRSLTGVINCKRKNGEQFKAELSSTIFVDELNNEYTFTNIIDLSEKQKLESLVLATGKMGIIGGWEYTIQTDELTYTNVLKEIIEVPLDFEPTLEFGISLYKEGDHRERVSALLEDALKNGTYFDEEFLIITAKGNEKWVRAICNPYIVNAVCVGLYGTFQDIDKRVRMENELRKIYQAIDQSYVSIVITDDKGNIEYVNPAFSALTGYSFEEAVGQNPRILKTGYTSEEEYKELWDKITHNEKWNGFFLNRKKNGETYWEHTNISAVKNNKGTITNFISVKENITERKIYEEQILQLNEELRELSNHLINIREEELSTIAKEIHDELAQNIVALNMNASWLKAKLKDSGAEIKEILDEQIHISELVIKSSRSLFNSLHPSMLDEIGLEAAIKWQTKSRLKNFSIGYEIHTNLSDIKISNEINLGLFRIFQECLTNIILHSKATKVSIDLQKIGGNIRLHIQDNGVGFDKMQINSLNGHGLLVIRERVYAMNGKFNLNSEINKGTTVDIRVPMTQ